MGSEEPTVILGFGSVLENSELYRLKSHYFPTGKVGGKPAWLNPKNLPAQEDICCPSCSKDMAFLAQLYCPLDLAEDTFHRAIFVFLCRNPNCSKVILNAQNPYLIPKLQMNDASNFRVFRCQLPRENDFYGMEALNPETDVDVPNPFFDEKTYPHLCEICGCSASKKCAKCQEVWYCSRDHQAIDWSLCGHKTTCGKPKPEANDVEMQEEEGKEFALPEKSKPLNPFVFPEYIIDTETEYISRGVLEHIINEANEDDAESDGEEDQKELAKRMKEMKKIETSEEISTNDVEEVEESASTKDKSFQIFQKVISRYADQIVRYSRGGKPLLATDFAPAPKNVPNCENCGAERIFELQLTPHLLSLIDVDSLGHSIDWATVLVYTCSESCSIKEFGYTKEFVFKQDFELLKDDSQPVEEEEE
uniref:MYND-type domain-containing protein n=1 Tax=Steinernema glaseri TaxID=37863 RepID=A0A1I7XVG1_9BILA